MRDICHYLHDMTVHIEKQKELYRKITAINKFRSMQR